MLLPLHHSQDLGLPGEREVAASLGSGKELLLPQEENPIVSSGDPMILNLVIVQVFVEALPMGPSLCQAAG